MSMRLLNVVQWWPKMLNHLEKERMEFTINAYGVYVL